MESLQLLVVYFKSRKLLGKLFDLLIRFHFLSLHVSLQHTVFLLLVVGALSLSLNLAHKVVYLHVKVVLVFAANS